MQIQDFVTIEKRGSTAIIWLDRKGESQNVFSPDVITAFEKILTEIEQNSEYASMVIASKKPDFIAGADIKSFAIEKEGDFRPSQEFGHTLLERVERNPKPCVSAVHGAAVGLGTEMSIACAAIVASDSPKTFFGLPEVKLGLLPGGGGTQRLPRRVGIQNALDMMLTGKNIYAYKAKKMGLVDEIAAPEKLLNVAVQLAQRLEKKPLVRKRKTSLVNKLLEGTAIGRNILFSQAKKIALKQSQGNYPAIPAIIDCVETSYKKGIEAGYEKELVHFEKLMLTPESDALRYLFFAMTGNKKNPYGTVEKPVENLGVIGAGFMGAGIAEVSVNKGIPVRLKDIKQETIDSAYKQIWKGFSKKIRYKSLTKVGAQAKMSKLSGQLSYNNFDKTDMVIEAVLEEMKLKKIIISQIEEHCKKDVIIASNTSSLSVTEMAQHAKHPEQVIGMHYFSPVPKMPLLEIVKTPQTSKEVIAACYDFGIRQGKTCIVVKDGTGFYVNRILAPYINECLTMVEEGVAFEKVDKALKKLGFPVGPITLVDQVGIDIAAHVSESSKPLVANREGFRVIDVLDDMVAADLLGRKGGKGFYEYDSKTKKKKGVNKNAYRFFAGNGTQDLPMDEIQNRALMMMINEAVMCLEEGIIANEEDGNLGAVFGIGFLPFTGGPFKYIDRVGKASIVEKMKTLEANYGPRFKARPWLLEA